MNRIFLARISVAEMVLWKSLNAETDPKVSLGSFFFSRIIGNPSKTEKCWGISEYFGSVSAIFTFHSFPVFWVRFLFIWVSFQFKKSFKSSVCWSISLMGLFPLLLGSVYLFSEKVLNSQFVDCFPLFLDPIPCWGVSVAPLLPGMPFLYQRSLEITTIVLLNSTWRIPGPVYTILHCTVLLLRDHTNIAVQLVHPAEPVPQFLKIL